MGGGSMKAWPIEDLLLPAASIRLAAAGEEEGVDQSPMVTARVEDEIDLEGGGAAASQLQADIELGTEGQEEAPRAEAPPRRRGGFSSFVDELEAGMSAGQSHLDRVLSWTHGERSEYVPLGPRWPRHLTSVAHPTSIIAFAMLLNCRMRHAEWACAEAGREEESCNWLSTTAGDTRPSWLAIACPLLLFSLLQLSLRASYLWRGWARRLGMGLWGYERRVAAYRVCCCTFTSSSQCHSWSQLSCH